MERIADLLDGKYLGNDRSGIDHAFNSAPHSESSRHSGSVPKSEYAQADQMHLVSGQMVETSQLAGSQIPQHEPYPDDGLTMSAALTGNTPTIDGAGFDQAGLDQNERAGEPRGVSIPAEDLRELWEGVVSALRDQIDGEVLNAWIRTLDLAALTLPASFDGDAIATISAPNSFICDHAAENYGPFIAFALKRLLSASVTLVFQIDPSLKQAPRLAPKTRSAATTPLAQEVTYTTGRPTNDQPGSGRGASLQDSWNHLPSSAGEAEFEPSTNSSSFPSSALGSPSALAGSITGTPAVGRSRSRTNGAVPQATGRSLSYDETNLNPKYNFSNFVVGGCNQFAHAVGLRVAENLGSAYNPLFVYGGVGLGKTHLANAIGNSSIRRHKKALLVSSETFVSELIASLRGNRMDQFKSKFRSLDLLIIDDIQFIIGKERTQEEFFHTFNELYNRHKQIVITSDKTPQELVGLEERLRTRFASGLSVDLQVPDFETRVAILSKKAESESALLSEEVCRYIAEHIDTNVRELEGALNRLCAISSLHRTPITLALAHEVVRSLVTSRKTRELTYEFIQQTVAEAYNVSLSDLLGKRRTQNIALARQVAMYLVRRLTGYSYPEIGAFFGGRDHSTVIHANKIITERMQADNDLRMLIATVEKRLKSA